MPAIEGRQVAGPPHPPNVHCAADGVRQAERRLFRRDANGCRANSLLQWTTEQLLELRGRIIFDDFGVSIGPVDFVRGHVESLPERERLHCRRSTHAPC